MYVGLVPVFVNVPAQYNTVQGARAVKRPIYLDHNATTPADPRVVEAMLPYFTEHFGNAASRTHSHGWKAEEAVEQARNQIATLIGCQPREIVFTSGATESNNLAILGVVGMHRRRASPAATPCHIVTSAIEHHAVLDPCAFVESGDAVSDARADARADARGPSTTRARGPVRVTRLPPDCHGQISAAQVRGAITDDTVLVTVMAANNEIGTVNPIAQIGAVCREAGVLFHTDAAQAVGKLPLQVEGQGIDLLSISAHKFYGPKGVGALFVRRRSAKARLVPMLHGGGHERGLRSGTLNVPGIVGLGAACEIARQELAAEAARTASLRDRFQDGILAQLDGVHINGHPGERLPGTLNLGFEGVQGEALIMDMRGLSVSSGSACTSSSPEPSYVLRALGVSPELAHASIRFGFGRFSTADEVDVAIDTVTSAVRQLREISAVVIGSSTY